MQNKGVILTFAILLTLVCLYQLSFTFVTYKIKQDAKEYAQGDVQKELTYLDSLSNEVVYNFLGLTKYTFKECQQREINLGLDLKGGMNVILEVSAVDILKSLSNNPGDTTLNATINRAKEMQLESREDFITLFGRAFQEVAPGARLATKFITPDQSEIQYESTDEEVITYLRDETQGAIDNAFNILRSRIDKFGVVQPRIQQLETQGRILVELPGVKDQERVRRLLQSTANLEFWTTYQLSEIYQDLLDANNTIKEIEAASSAADTSSGLLDEETSILDELASDTLGTDSTDLGYEQWRKEYPLFALLRPNVDRDGNFSSGSVVGRARGIDTAKINRYLRMDRIRGNLNVDLKFLWSALPMKDPETGKFTDVYELHAIKTTRDGKPPLEGDVVTSARPDFDQNTGEAEVSMSMNGVGSKRWAKITKDNVGRSIAIVLDNSVYSSPVVRTEIKGGSSAISGSFTFEDAQDLANILKSGKLPAPARIIQEAVVGPTLGKESINAGLNSFLIAFVVILMYMFFYYSRKAGLVADIALLANMFFIIGVLASLGAALTLPGIAGIVLTIGMSVDANVLIYERVREELASGKGLKLALSDGYKNAYSAIIDANVTTLLTGVILYVFGAGPIKGFATTLVIGILTSLFSAIFITRLIFLGMLNRNRELTFATKITEGVFKNTQINFIDKRKVFYIISSVIVVLGIVSLVVKGLNPGVDFTGGRTYVVRFHEDEPVSTLEVQNLLKEVYGEAPEVVTFGGNNQVRIVTQYKINENDPEVDEEVETKLFEGLKPLYSHEIDNTTFLSEYLMSSQKIGPTIADDIKIGALLSITFALIIIFLYILIRFRNWQFGMGAVLALIHDSLIILGIFSIFYGLLPFSLEIDLSFIAAILTVVGYSINDTVVVFDRIREYVGLYRKRERKEIINLALNSTLSRTFSTSLSTFFVLLAIFLFGGEVIRGFTFALLLGIVVGTYSSLFIATPVVYDTIKQAETARVLRGKRRS